MKQIFCPLWGFIELTPLLSKILDTEEVQRLRDIKQLGATYFVFPSATHTRLEHSLGVCHLARLLGESLQKNHPEHQITSRDIELWQVAGLIHDIGHGPFSHLYDHYMRLAGEPEHEERGLSLFDTLCKREKIPITAEEINDIHRMVDPKGADIHHWKYQLIANKVSQIDVDKIDYIQRDSFHVGIPHAGEFSRLLTGARICQTEAGTQELAWNEKLQFDVFSLFAARYRLHKQVYTHHTVKAFEYIIIEIMKEMRSTHPEISLANISDAVILCGCYINPTKNGKALMKRKHPKCVGEYVISEEKCAEIAGLDTIPAPKIRLVVDFIIEEIKIGFVSGNGGNPLKKVYYYSEKDKSTPSLQGFNINIKQTSFIIPEKFQERIIRMYTLQPEITEEAKAYWQQLISTFKK